MSYWILKPLALRVYLDLLKPIFPTLQADLFLMERRTEVPIQIS